MAIHHQLYAARYLDVDAVRLRAQGVQCPHPTRYVAVLSAMRDAVNDLFLERAKSSVQQATVLVSASGWDRSAIDLPPLLKKLRSGKLDRVVIAFEGNDAAESFRRARFNWTTP